MCQSSATEAQEADETSAKNKMKKKSFEPLPKSHVGEGSS